MKFSLKISKDSNWVVAIQVTDYQQYQLVKENLKTKKCLYFKYRHEVPAESVLLYESKNIVMTGGLDQMLVIYNWTSGVVMKVIHLVIGPISSLFRIGHLGVLGESHALRFVDTRDDIEFKMMDPLATHCKFVSCMEVVPFQNSVTEEPGHLLVYGGSDSGNLNTFILEEHMQGESY
jgi:hypothetical protein